MAERIYLRGHAVERYRERVKPALSKTACTRELIELVDGAGEPVPEVDWHTAESNPPDAYLVLSDGVALCLRAGRRRGASVWWAITCITRSGCSPTVRAARNARRARRRAARRWRSRNATPPTRRTA